MDETQHPFPPEDGEPIFQRSQETESQSDFRLLPFDPSNFPEERLAVIRAINTTHIKESLQDYTRLDRDVREFREVSTRGDYIWSIITDLGMTNSELPTPAFREAFLSIHEKAKAPKNIDMVELLDKYEEHPAIAFTETLRAISSKSEVYSTEIVMLKRSMLLLLDEHS